jgi:ATP-dependent Clp protease ATP-binding subunit ClpX
VVCLDEFDKLAGQSSNTRFAGQETTKDVSGWGVQRSLLGLLSAPRAEYAPDYGFSGRTAPRTIELAGVTFVACGAFSRLRPPADAAQRALGFGAAAAGPTAPEPIDPTALERHGFMPELVGRFNRLVELAPLGLEELRSILAEQAGRYRRELEAEGLELELPQSRLDALAEAALRDRLGARGLRTSLTRIVEDLLYERIGA